MAHLIILAGSDRVGKSTYAQFLKDRFDSVCTVHFGAPQGSHPFDMYYDQANKVHCTELEVWDRSHICEAALGPWRRKTTIPLLDFVLLQGHLEDFYDTVNLVRILAPVKSAIPHLRKELEEQNQKNVEYKIRNLALEHEFYQFQSELMANALAWDKQFVERAYTPNENWHSFQHFSKFISKKPKIGSLGGVEGLYPGLAVGSPCECKDA